MSINIERRTVMSSSGFVLILGSTYLMASSLQAGCSPALTEEIASAERIVDSLRPDKAGQMREFASDGSEYSAGEAQWLKSILGSCGRGDEAAAAATLHDVTELLKAHRRVS